MLCLSLGVNFVTFNKNIKVFTVRCNSNTFFTILKKRNIDFIALAITPWHALGIDAFLFEKSKKSNKKIRGIITLLPNNDKYVVNEKNFSCKNFVDVDFYYIENLSNQSFKDNTYNVISEGFDILKGMKNCRNNKNNKKILFLISPWTPYLPFIEYFKDKEISNNYKPIFVAVDEGVRIYLSKKSHKLGIKHLSKFSLLAEIKLRSYTYVDKLLRKIITKYVPFEKRFVFEYETSFKRNDNIVDLYKNIIELKNNDLRINGDNIALIVTQPLSELKMVSKTQECEILNEIIQLFNENKIKTLIKPHPYEATDKYDYLKKKNVKFIEGNFPVEEIIPVLNPICVIGVISTALINLKLIFNVNSISIVNLLKMDNELMEYTIQDFKELSKNFIKFVDNMDEIIDFLDLNSDSKS